MSPSVDTPVRIKRELSESPTPARSRPSKSDRSRNGANTSSGASPASPTTASTNADVLRRTSFRHHTSIEQLLAKRTDLRLVDVKQQPATMSGADVLGPDEEIWMFQCARNVPIQQLVGVKLNLSGARKTVRLSDDGSIEYQSDAGVGRTHTMVCRPHGGRRHELVSFQPVGTVRVHDEIQELHVVDFAHVKQGLVPYPTGLKVRHPLHGSDYEKLTNLSADVKSKLRSAVRASGLAQSEQLEDAKPTLPIKQERSSTKRVKAERGIATDVESPAKKTTSAIPVAGKKRKAKTQVDSGIDGEANADVSARKKVKRAKEHVKLETVDDADEEPGANLDWLSAI